MKRKEKYSKENMELVIKESSSIKEALRKLNLRAAGGNYKVFHKYVIKYGLDISHFESKIKIYQRTLGVKNMKRKKPLSEILVLDSTYCRTHLKERLYLEGVKKRECEECGQNEIWRGKKISLILDHINGNNSDNRLENLRILCPNCNSTLETHCGKNMKILKLKKENIKYTDTVEYFIKAMEEINSKNHSYSKKEVLRIRKAHSSFSYKNKTNEELQEILEKKLEKENYEEAILIKLEQNKRLK